MRRDDTARCVTLLARLSKSPLFFFFLVGYAILKSVAARPHALKLASLTFKNLREVDL